MTLKNEKPWHGLSVNVNTHLAPSEILYKLKIDRDFGSHPIPSGMPKNFANQEVIRFFNSFFEAGGVHGETFGVMDGGRIIWALAPLEEDFILSGEDLVKGYLLLASRNENRMSVEIQFIVIRAVCNNTIRVTWQGKDTFKNVFRREFIREFPFMTPVVKSFEEKLIRNIKEIISRGQKAIITFAEAAERLVHKKVDTLVANRYLFDVFQADMGSPHISPKEIEDLADKKTRIAINAFKEGAPGQGLKTAQMTAWGLLNAVTYTIDHQLGNHQDSRLRQAWFGFNAKIKKRAFDLALELL